MGKGVNKMRCGCSNFDVCTIIPLLIILSKSGLLKDNNTFILILLFWLCGGVNAFPRGGRRCGCRCCCGY